MIDFPLSACRNGDRRFPCARSESAALPAWPRSRAGAGASGTPSRRTGRGWGGF